MDKKERKVQQLPDKIWRLQQNANRLENERKKKKTELSANIAFTAVV